MRLCAFRICLILLGFAYLKKRYLRLKTSIFEGQCSIIFFGPHQKNLFFNNLKSVLRNSDSVVVSSLNSLFDLLVLAILFTLV